MAKICILSALLLELLYTSVQGQNSPCPDRFTYIKKPGSDETIGQIEIRNIPKNKFELRLKVDLKVATLLPTSFVGRVDLTKSKEDAAHDVLQGRPLLYHIYFPIQNPLPTVHRIWFNNDQICSGPEVSGKVTTIKLEHILKISIQPPQNQSNPPPQNRPVKQIPPRPSQQVLRPALQITSRLIPRRGSRLVPRPTEPVPVSKIENYNECGISRGRIGGPNLLIVHGNETLPGEWPWLAAIFKVIYEFEFLCGGTILTAKHVLTAGHCLKRSPRSNDTTPANILSVALGRYKLMDFNEQGSVTMEVARHITHPEYTHAVTADADLAIIILKSPVKFTAYIRPICLLSPSVDSRRLEQTDGIIVGWGEDEYGNRYTEEPRLATMPIVRTDICHWSHPSLSTITSERTFCAGRPDPTSGVCNGDSGSGMVIFDSVTGRYYLRGIVSRMISNQLCDQTAYTVFVDVFKYLPWITNTLKIIIQPLQNQPNPSPQSRSAEHEPSRPSQQATRPYPQPTPRPALRPTTAPVDEIENYNECGVSKRRSGRPNLLIAHGKKTLPGEWPWVAAIFKVTYVYKFLCGGTILTTKHVLTAAHCLKTSYINNETTPANILSVILGRYRLMDFNEQGSVTMDVATYIFHPEYTHTATADSDLAIIILKSPVEFTDFISPICLLPPSLNSRRPEQTDGIIVGWGEDEYGYPYTEQARLANMLIVTTDVCLRSNAYFASITSERTLCAVGRNHGSPCNGDAGSGLVIFDSVTGRYHLRGVVSRKLANQPCDQTNYVVFVDVFKYLYWIYNQMDST